ncbi:FmdB family zinc ribbon protein [Rhodococcus sp. (in: high G+C Gram-positive bacteria)]|uniref:FmdB family zinc ribbon protein n=1 Tax=Rhodococcus sp. TaxID=1831 RepID=UPI00388F5A71
MPLYEYRCVDCGPFDVSVSMSDVRPTTVCPACAAESPRAITAPRFGRGPTAAMRVLDSTARTASEPAVVSGAVPGRPRTPPRPVTTDPRHRMLPRP